MIRVTLRIGGGVGGRTRVEPLEILLSEGATIGSMVEMLGPKMGIEDLPPSILVAINGRRVDESDRAGWVLKDGDIMSVVMALTGG